MTLTSNEIRGRQNKVLCTIVEYWEIRKYKFSSLLHLFDFKWTQINYNICLTRKMRRKFERGWQQISKKVINTTDTGTTFLGTSTNIVNGLVISTEINLIISFWHKTDRSYWDELFSESEQLLGACLGNWSSFFAARFLSDSRNQFSKTRRSFWERRFLRSRSCWVRILKWEESLINISVRICFDDFHFFYRKLPISLSSTKLDIYWPNKNLT